MLLFPEFWISIHNAWNASSDVFSITVYLNLWLIYIYQHLQILLVILAKINVYNFVLLSNSEQL